MVGAGVWVRDPVSNLTRRNASGAIGNPSGTRRDPTKTVESCRKPSKPLSGMLSWLSWGGTGSRTGSRRVPTGPHRSSTGPRRVPDGSPTGPRRVPDGSPTGPDGSPTGPDESPTSSVGFAPSLPSPFSLPFPLPLKLLICAGRLLAEGEICIQNQPQQLAPTFLDSDPKFNSQALKIMA